MSANGHVWLTEIAYVLLPLWPGVVLFFAILFLLKNDMCYLSIYFFLMSINAENGKVLGVISWAFCFIRNS